MYTIEIYEDKNGNSTIRDYLQEIQASKTKENKIKINKIIAYIDLLSAYGFKLHEPYIKHLTGDIWELRPLKDRILFACYENHKFILLTCFRKETQKTPQKEIKKAMIFLEDYKKRSEEK